MEDSFRVRVDKTFNTLSSSSSPSPQTLTPSLWCLTDEEIEKRQWPREPDASIPIDDDEDDDDDNDDAFLATNVDKFFFKPKDEKSMASEDNRIANPNPNPRLTELDFRKEVEDDLKELDDGGNERGCSEKNEEDEVVEEDEVEVKKVIGMDCTLDFEEEEDGYDKVAVGTDKTGQCLYMSDVTEYTPDIESYNELPNAFKEAPRDPRANHLAAKRRLKEDAETAKSFNSLHVSDHSEDGASGPAQNDALEDENLPKSILKRKDDQMDSKSEKRVRFEPVNETDDHSTSEGDKVVSEASNVDSTLYKQLSMQQHDSSLVPDHVRHPLRYTHYTFDSSPDMNEESNRQAYMDFLNMVKKSKSEPDEDPADLTKPIIFNPKKKGGDASMVSSSKSEHSIEEPVQKKSVSVSIAASIAKEDEPSEMEVDEHETAAAAAHKVSNGRRAARKYRSKVTLEPNS